MDYELQISDEALAKKKKRNEIFDKITTGILIALMATPILILAYIFSWFMMK
jgi:ABC-type dipeptide/oligopeptide/nickel transport system permease component